MQSSSTQSEHELAGMAYYPKRVASGCSLAPFSPPGATHGCGGGSVATVLPMWLQKRVEKPHGISRYYSFDGVHVRCSVSWPVLSKRLA